MAKAKKKPEGEDPKKIAVLLIVVCFAGWTIYKNVFAKSSGGRVAPNQRPGASPGARAPGQPPGAPPAGRPAGGAAPAPADRPPIDPNAQITVRPTDIPQLSPEVKAKLKDRGHRGSGIYPDEKAASGFNPFLTFEVDQEKFEPVRGSKEQAEKEKQKKKKPKFTKQMKFWGAFTTEEETKAIVEVENAPIPWTGHVGDPVDGTPFVLSAVSSDGRSVTLIDPDDPEVDPVTLFFEGVKEEVRKPAKGGGTGGGLFKPTTTTSPPPPPGN